MEAARRVVDLVACVVDLHVDVILLVLVVDLVEAFEYPPNEYYVFRSGNSLPKGKYIIALGKNKNVVHLRVAALLNTS